MTVFEQLQIEISKTNAKISQLREIVERIRRSEIHLDLHKLQR